MAGTLSAALGKCLFGLRVAIVRLQPAAPALSVTDFSAWERVQVKLAASQTAQLDALQALGFQLVEGEVDFSLTLSPQGDDPAAEMATEDIPVLRQMAAQAFAQSRFRAPWYAPDDSGRFYAQWIENAVKGTFDHVTSAWFSAQGTVKSRGSSRCVSSTRARRVLAY